MSRHRNVRGMNYDDDYDGYDDVYGHSVEEEYGVSPSTAEEFMYRRSYHEHHLASYMEEIGEGGEEEDEEQPQADSKRYQKPKLSDVDEARLQSCLEGIRNVVGESIPEHVLIEAVLTNNFDLEKAIDSILNQQEDSNKKSASSSRHSKDESKSKILGKGNAKTLHNGKGVAPKQTNKSEIRSGCGVPEANKLLSHGTLSGLLVKSDVSLPAQDREDNLKTYGSSLSSLIQKQPASSLVKPGSAPGLNLSSLAQLHLSSNSQSTGATLGLGSLASSNTALGSGTKPGQRSQENHSGVSLASLASKHLETHSNPHSIHTKGQQTSLASLAEAHSAATSSAISGLSWTKPTSGASHQSGLGTATLSNQLSSLSIGKQEGPHLSQAGVGTGKGMSLSDLASQHLSYQREAESEISATPLLASGTGLSNQPMKDSIGLSTASSLGAPLDLPCESQNSHERSRPRSSVPSLLSLSQLKLAEPVMFSHTASADLSQQNLRSLVTKPFVKKPLARPPPGFDVESTKKTLPSPPPGFISLHGQDKSYDSNVSMLGNTQSPEKKNYAKPLCQYTSALFCKPSKFGRILSSTYIPPKSIHRIKKSQKAEVVKSIQRSGRQRKMIYRQFSYERQKSLGSSGDDMLDVIVPFDFSTPSPDDIVKAKQRRAFVSGGNK